MRLHSTYFRKILWITLLFSPALRAQPLDDMLKLLNDNVNNFEALIATWIKAANWSSGLSLTIIILGLVTSAVQGYSQFLGKRSEAPAEAPWSKKLLSIGSIVLFTGVAISALTQIRDSVFAADHREYRRSIALAHKLVLKFREGIVLLKGDPDAGNPVRLAELFKKELEPLQEQMTDIETKLTASNWPLLDRVVYASVVASARTMEGTGQSNFYWQAEQNAQTAAVEQLLPELAKAAGLPLGELERDALRKYVDAYGKQSQTHPEKTSTGRETAVAQVSLNRIYLNPALIGGFVKNELSAAAGLTREQQIEAIKHVAGRNDYLESPVTPLSLKGGKVKLEAPKAGDGSFVFSFSVTPPANGMAQVRLDSMEIYQDSEVGSTRWRFHVLSQGRVIMSLPEQRWDDSKHPTVCWWQSAPWLTAQAPVVNGSVPITIVAIKPRAQDKL